MGTITLFETLQLDRRLKLGLESMGLEQPTPVQEKMVPAVLTGTDLSVSAETGSGKTLAYLLPIIQQILSTEIDRNAATLALILVPTRELARQVLKQCRQITGKCPLSVQAITGGAEFKYQKSIFNKNPEIIVATPGRLMDLIERRVVKLDQISAVVLDEADDSQPPRPCVSSPASTSSTTSG